MKKYHFIIILSFASTKIFAQQQNKYAREGNRLYKEKKFDKALPEFEKAVEANAGDPIINFNYGNAFFRNSRFEDAAVTFGNTASKANDAALKEKAYYNQGVSFSKQQKLEESIVAYKSAVILDPSDEDARINLQKALLELKKKTPPEQQNKKEQKNKQEKKKDQQNPPPKSNLTKKQVEQLLKALQQREQQVQQKMQQRNRTSGQQEKDW